MDKDKLKLKSTVIVKDELYEMIYKKDDRKTFYIDKNGGLFDQVEEDGIIYCPNKPMSNLLKDNVILFASGLENYGTFKDLINDVRNFIHKYLDISELFEVISSYYVILSYIYDKFPNIVYLRFIGDFGGGKSRALDTIGNICYKSIFTTGATTISPIFRLLNDYRGTLILDEADFRFSDTTSEMIKILNNGYQKNRPVIRSEQSNNAKNFDVASYNCFGPKILASRFRFEDLALESRCLTEVMNKDILRKDIPLQLDDNFYNEALILRNKLLKYRFDNFHKKIELSNFNLNKKIEPRLRQLISIILSIVEDEGERKNIIKFLEESDMELKNDRAMSFEGILLEAIHNILNFPDQIYENTTVGEITTEFNSLRENEKPLSAQKIGRILKDKLQINTEKNRNGKCLSLNSKSRIEILFEKYGFIENKENEDVNSVNSVNSEEAILIDKGSYKEDKNGNTYINF